MNYLSVPEISWFPGHSFLSDYHLHFRSLNHCNKDQDKLYDLWFTFTPWILNIPEIGFLETLVTHTSILSQGKLLVSRCFITYTLIFYNKTKNKKNKKSSFGGKQWINTQSSILKFFVFLTSYHFHFLSLQSPGLHWILVQTS